MTDAVNVTDRNLRTWLGAGAMTRGIGKGQLAFLTTESSATHRQASWVLRYRFAGTQRALVLGRYPDISLKDARELARAKRAQIQQGVDIAVQKQVEKLAALEAHNVTELSQAWFDRHIANRLNAASHVIMYPFAVGHCSKPRT